MLWKICFVKKGKKERYLLACGWNLSGSKLSTVVACGRGIGNIGDRVGDFSFWYILLLNFQLWKYIPSSYQCAFLSLRDQVPSPSQTPLKLRIENKFLTIGLSWDMEWKMEVGEYHLPAALGCDCWQAWPWVLKVNYGVGHGTGHSVPVPSHELPGHSVTSWS